MKRELAVLEWPDQAAEADRLGKLRLPRLLLVPADVDPPRDTDHLLDWVRVPANEHEVAARVVALMQRAEDDTVRIDEPPMVDLHGRFVYRDRWAALSPTEARLATVLCEQFMQVVSHAELLRRVWRTEEPGREAPKRAVLRVHLTRLRQRIGDLGLEVVSIRKQGIVLQPAPSQSPA